MHSYVRRFIMARIKDHSRLQSKMIPVKLWIRSALKGSCFFPSKNHKYQDTRKFMTAKLHDTHNSFMEILISSNIFLLQINKTSEPPPNDVFCSKPPPVCARKQVGPLPKSWRDFVVALTKEKRFSMNKNFFFRHNEKVKILVMTKFSEWIQPGFIRNKILKN